MARSDGGEKAVMRNPNSTAVSMPMAYRDNALRSATENCLVALFDPQCGGNSIDSGDSLLSMASSDLPIDHDARSFYKISVAVRKSGAPGLTC